MTEGLWQLGERRRVCVGYGVVQMELFVVVARLVAGFDFVTVSFPSFRSFFLSSICRWVLWQGRV